MISPAAIRKSTSFDMERGIARCRVVLSLVAILALYVDPTEPTLTNWIPLGSGFFSISWYWASVLIAHLTYSLMLVILQGRSAVSHRHLTTIATCGDVLFAIAIAVVTEGTTSPFYSFFAFAVLAAGLRSGLPAALVVTAISVALYALLIVVAAPANQAFYIVMRAAYIAITGYLVGYLGQERLNLEARIGSLETEAQRERIARSLHDGYAQALAGVNLRLETCRELFRRGQASDAIAELSDLQVGVAREQDEVREYIRSLMDSEAPRPSGTIDPDGPARVSIDADFRASATLVEHVLLIALEGVRNVRRHAHARAADIRIRSVAGQLVLTIDDDGIGFPADAKAPWSMRSRVAECGGQLSLSREGRSGAHVHIRLPEE